MLTRRSRQFFPPTGSESESEAATSKSQDTAADDTPALPDVPTKEPTESGQPQAKKQRLDDA